MARVQLGWQEAVGLVGEWVVMMGRGRLLRGGARGSPGVSQNLSALEQGLVW